MPDRERASIDDELNPPFEVTAPAEPRGPVVLCSPHSGRIYTRHFLALSRLDPLALRRSEDCYVDDLLKGAAALGVPLIAARFPRAYLDVNRERHEFDPELFSEALPDYANTQSIRVVGGLGTIARIVADGEPIYARPLAFEAALARIEQLYDPFHAALSDLLEAARARFGYAILVDCHSMPSSQITQSPAVRPDFVIGDRFGASCDPRLSRILREAVAGLGYDVQMNRPYAGGHITEHYGRPARGLHALQIEVNRKLYVDERTLEPTTGYARLAAVLTGLVERLLEEAPPIFEAKAAAE